MSPTTDLLQRAARALTDPKNDPCDDDDGTKHDDGAVADEDNA